METPRKIDSPQKTKQTANQAGVSTKHTTLGRALDELRDLVNNAITHHPKKTFLAGIGIAALAGSFVGLNLGASLFIGAFVAVCIGRAHLVELLSIERAKKSPQESE